MYKSFLRKNHRDLFLADFSIYFWHVSRHRALLLGSTKHLQPFPRVIFAEFYFFYLFFFDIFFHFLFLAIVVIGVVVRCSLVLIN